MPKAFFSHSSHQKQLIETLANRIGRDNCVLDKYNFEAGSPTLDEIIKGIDETDLFILFITNESLNSEWVQKEIAYAKNLQNKAISKQLLILNVGGIEHTDPRIPQWLATEYNLKPITDTVLIYKKINSKLRDISISTHPYVAKKEEIFIGRNDLMNEFEKKYHNINLTKPTVITASGFEGVGRRKFLSHALHKAGRDNKFHDPITISLDTRDSIEDFILRIEDLNSKKTDEILEILLVLSLEDKIEYAKNLLLRFQEQNEILYILDKGCIIQPNKQIAAWFTSIINSENFANNTIICLVSTFRQFNTLHPLNKKIISFYVNELTPSDRQILFVKYCELFEIHPSPENTEQILNVLNGMPEQIFFTVLLIKDHGSDFVIKNIDEIKRYDDFRVFNVIDQIRNSDETSFNILLFISRFEFVSFDLVYKIFGRTNETDTALDTLFIWGIFDRIGVDKEYIKIHHAISDYILRAKMDLPLQIKQILKKEIESIMKQKSEFPDVSEILVTIRSLIIDGSKIPEKYFIPSVTLRTIVEYYYDKQYPQVYELAQRFLENYRKYDETIIREIRYWYCMALARKTKESFFEQLGNFEGVDYYFLFGFFRRMEKKYEEAEKLFLQALQFDSESQKARRELVTVLLKLGKYNKAIDWAKENYERKKLNAFHIQAYFICLLRKYSWTPSEKDIIDELMNEIQKSHDFKAKEIYEVMKGEYEYYIKGDFENAVQLLNKAKEQSNFKSYPIKALAEIYKRRGMIDKESNLNKMLDRNYDIDE